MKNITGIYVRRSMGDRDNKSLSIASQKTDCIKSLEEGEEYRIYCDEGKSGKDVQHRPAFLQMMSDAKDGMIDKIIVKKYDRFGRSAKDFLNVMDELESYGVGLASMTEPFNTTTNEGRLMRDIIIRFAQFERETIAARVADAYNTRSVQMGFYQGGSKMYGYDTERKTVNGKNGSVLVPSDGAEIVKTMFQLYKNPDTSLMDIINYFRDRDIDVNRSKKGKLDRSGISKILKLPHYVRANKEVYQYFVSLGYEMIDDVEAFDGVHGLFQHEKSDGTKYIKVGYHEGLVDSEIWLAVQDKKSRNIRIPNNGEAKNSWLVGLVKCGVCKYSLLIYYTKKANRNKIWRYFVDSGSLKTDCCFKKRLRIKPDEAERIVFEAMKERLESLVIARAEKRKPDVETENLKAEIIHCDDEIRKLMDKMADADKITFEYIQERIRTIHSKKSGLEEKLRFKTRKQKEIDTKPLTDPMNRWDELTISEKHAVAVALIDVIYISEDGGIDIRFGV